jgi:hypothetical protein
VKAKRQINTQTVEKHGGGGKDVVASFVMMQLHQKGALQGRFYRTEQPDVRGYSYALMRTGTEWMELLANPRKFH